VYIRLNSNVSSRRRLSRKSPQEKRRKRMKRICLITLATVLLVSLISMSCGATPPATAWNKTFGGSGYDDGYSVQQTSDEGYVVAGYTNSYGAGGDDVWLIKTDSSGNMAWNKTFGGSGYDDGYSVQQTSDEGYVVAGYTNSYGAGGDDVWLIKTDSSGNMAWNKTFGGSGYDDGYSVQQTSDGGYIIVGTTIPGFYSDVYLIKTDSSGNLEWNKTFAGLGNDHGYSIQQTSDGGYIIAGYTRYIGEDNDVWLIKVTA
jgi:predicted secreted protein